MIVVSDTSPITALLRVGEAELLPKLFQRVLIPPAVAEELRCRHPLPPWMEVHPISDSERYAAFADKLDSGEAEAIALALELHADHLLMDERRGRQIASRIGLVGIVVLAKRQSLISSARALIHRLETNAGIYLSAEVREASLKRIGE